MTAAVTITVTGSLDTSYVMATMIVRADYYYFFFSMCMVSAPQSAFIKLENYVQCQCVIDGFRKRLFYVCKGCSQSWCEKFMNVRKNA